MRKIECGDMVLWVGEEGGGEIDCSALKEACENCGSTECVGCLEMSKALMDYMETREYNAAIDGVSSLVLACCLAGIDVESEKFRGALDAALDAVGNQF